MAKPFSEQLRQAVLSSELSRYSISVATGIAQSVLSKFVHKKGGLGLESIDKLMDCLGLEIRPTRKKGK
jgi:hypothetical protein